MPGVTEQIFSYHQGINYRGRNIANKCEDKSTWATGGGLLVGIGVGFLFLPDAPIAFIGSLLAGLGIGLVITPIISRTMRQEKNQ